MNVLVDMFDRIRYVRFTNFFYFQRLIDRLIKNGDALLNTVFVYLKFILILFDFTSFNFMLCLYNFV